MVNFRKELLKQHTEMHINLDKLICQYICDTTKLRYDEATELLHHISIAQLFDWSNKRILKDEAILRSSELYSNTHPLVDKSLNNINSPTPTGHSIIK